MAMVNFVEDAEQLRMIKDRAAGVRRWGIVTAVGAGLALIGLVSIWITSIFGIALIIGGIVALLISVPQLVRFLTKGEWLTFSRPRDMVSENDKPICKVSELKGIEVERYTRLSKEGKPYFTRFYTNLLMPDGSKKEIDFATEPTNSEVIGNRIAAYLSISLLHTDTVRQEGVNA